LCSAIGGCLGTKSR